MKDTMHFLLFMSLLCVTVAINSYEPPPCFGNVKDCRETLGRKAIATLKDKYLLMIGDSLTRYQYLSLVYTLRHRNPPHVEMYPNMNENTHGEWMRFFETTNDVLSPYEHCDCSYYDGRFFEHRRYHDAKNNISVTYLMYRGFFIEGTNDTNSLHAPGDKALTAPKWGTNMKDYLLKQFTPKKVDYLVANVGFFGFHESIIPSEFISWCQQLSDRVVWKTTTSVQLETPEKPYVDRHKFNAIDSVMCATKHVHCMDTSWTMKVDQVKDYWNSNHFNEPVYSILNDQLMDMLVKVPAHRQLNGARKEGV